MFQKEPRYITVDTLISTGKLDNISSRKHKKDTIEIKEEDNEIYPVKTKEESITVTVEPVLQKQESNREIKKIKSKKHNLPSNEFNFSLRGSDILWIGDNDPL